MHVSSFLRRSFQKKRKKKENSVPSLTQKGEQQGYTYQKAFRNLLSAKIELVACRFKGLHKIIQVKRHLCGLPSPGSWWTRQGAQDNSQFVRIFKDTTQVNWLFMASTRMPPPSPHVPPLASYSNYFPACLSYTLLGTNSPPSAGLSLSFLWLNFTTFPSTPLSSSPSYGRLFNHSLVQQPSQVYLQSSLRVHSVLSYSSILRVLRIPKPSTEPWRALPGTGFCH